MNDLWRIRRNLKVFCAVAAAGILLHGCKATPDSGAFDLQAKSTGALDSKGYPVLLGGQYERGVPLKRNIERVKIERELKAIADTRRNPGIKAGSGSGRLSQRELREIARTHGAKTEAEIKGACSTDENGIVTCKTD